MAQGFFITFEGGEGGGKSTQTKLLAEALKAKGYDVVLTREPGGSPAAEKIRALLVSGDTKWDSATEALLHSAARRQHLVDTIWPALQLGKIVISDRYSDSTKAYQVAGQSADERQIAAIITASTSATYVPDSLSAPAFYVTKPPIASSLRTELLDPKVSEPSEYKPNLTFILDISAEEGLNRAMARPDMAKSTAEDRYERMGLEFHRRLRQKFLDIAKAEPERCKVIDATRSVADIHADILNAALAALEKATQGKFSG